MSTYLPKVLSLSYKARECRGRWEVAKNITGCSWGCRAGYDILNDQLIFVLMIVVNS